MMEPHRTPYLKLCAIVGRGKVASPEKWGECPVMGYWPVGILLVRCANGGIDFSQVDTWYFDWLIEHTWRKNRKGYARTEVKNKPAKTSFSLHSLVCNPPNGLYADHKNQDKMDNREANLRPATNSQNHANMKPRATTMPYPGIMCDPPSSNLKKRWRAAVTVNMKSIRSKRFATPEEARDERLRMAKHYFGEFSSGY
jgi:hypothetical protein